MPRAGARLFFLVFLLLYVTKIQCFRQNNTGNLVKCKKEYLYGPKGIISSPGYPESYSNHTSCSWHIFGKPGEIITVSFDHLDIEEDIPCDVPPCCNNNWLKIGPTSNSEGNRYCGQKHLKPPPFFSINNRIWIKFHISNVAKGGRGFQLSYIISSRKAKYCGKDEFHCSDSKCILSQWQCNHYNECKDGSDEIFCKDECPMNFLPCLSGIQCYSIDKHCDGIADCSDLSDELDCTYCGKNKIRCGVHSLQCFDITKERCNRILDCKNGEDEKGCFGCGEKISCSSGRGCYSQEERCNGVAKCGDYSDEKNCDPNLCKSERGGFLCRNGGCIREMWKCDRTDDCGDGSDEENCLRNSVVSAAVMGSLVCGLLLVVAVGCTCRLYSLRSMERRMAGREVGWTRHEPPPPYTWSVSVCGLGSHSEDRAPPVASGRSGRSRRREHGSTLLPVVHRAQQEPTSSGLLLDEGGRLDGRAVKEDPEVQPEETGADDENLDWDHATGDRQSLITDGF